MSRLTLELPQTLHNQLTNLAGLEGISLDQYVIYSLTRQASMAYMVRATPEHIINQQKTSFEALLQSLGTASFDEIEQLMSEREEVDPEPGLTSDMVQKLQHRINQKRQVMQPA